MGIGIGGCWRKALVDERRRPEDDLRSDWRGEVGCIVGDRVEGLAEDDEYSELDGGVGGVGGIGGSVCSSERGGVGTAGSGLMR